MIQSVIDSLTPQLINPANYLISSAQKYL